MLNTLNLIIMDELGFTLAGFAVLGVLHYAVAIVFAVSEYRKWLSLIHI